MVDSAIPSDAGAAGLMSQPNALQAALEGIVTIDGRMRIAMINPAAERMFGRTAAELLGSDLAVLVPERLREQHAVHVQRFMASDLSERPMGQRGQMTGLRASGEEFPMETALCKVEVAGGGRYYTALLRDMSEEHKLSVLVERINQRMRTIFDLVPVAIWITECDEVVYANPACVRLFGAKAQDSFAGRSIYHFLSPDSHERVRGKVALALAHQESVLSVEGEIARPDGSSRQVEMVVAALPDHQRTLVQMVIADVTKQTQERGELLRSQRTLRRLSASLVEAREEERRRIARELHDELGQRLTALKLELVTLDRADSARSRAERTQAMIEMVDDTVAATRRISMDLRPLMLDDLGLNAAIEWLARDFERHTGLRVTLRLAPIQDLIGSRTATALYRIVQEALTNCARHARANAAEVALAPEAKGILLTVSDDGDGFATLPPQSPRDSFGLIGIRERVYMLGGELSVSNIPGGGARLAVYLPWGKSVELPAGGPSESDGDSLPVPLETRR